MLKCKKLVKFVEYYNKNNFLRLLLTNPIPNPDLKIQINIKYVAFIIKKIQEKCLYKPLIDV